MSAISGEGAPTSSWSGVIKVEEYSQTKGLLGAGNCFRSSVFSVGGHGWRIEYYPDGYNLSNTGWISFGLSLDRPHEAKENVEAQFAFTLLDKAGAPVLPYTGASGVCNFSSKDPSWGLERFIERRELESSPRLEDDSFSVRCCVTVLKGKGDESAVAVPAFTAFGIMASEVGEEHEMVVEVNKKMMEEHLGTVVATCLVGMDEIYSTGK
ncbi:unnamed protein product [Urochloa humidicola]